MSAEQEQQPQSQETEKPKLPTEISWMVSREGKNFVVEDKYLDPNRPLPIDPPQVERMWDRKAAVPPQYLGFAWRNYSARYLDAEKPTLFDLFFGSQEKIAHFKEAHPCNVASEKVFSCLDRNAERKEKRADFCRSIINVFEGCLREHNL